MRYWMLLLSLIFVGPLSAQQAPPDNDDILMQTANSASPYYYPALFLRYMSDDSTLTAKDYYYLYYGYAYQDSYRPLEAIPAETQLLDIFARNRHPEGDDARKIIEYGEQVMKADPFSPRNINYMTYAYGVLGDTIKERAYADKLGKILATIQSSGNGLKESTPWHVLQFSHTLDVLATMGLEAQKRQVVTRTVEYVPLVVRDGRVKGYYFDFGRVYWRKPDNLPEKRSQGWQFNGIKIK